MRIKVTFSFNSPIKILFIIYALESIVILLSLNIDIISCLHKNLSMFYLFILYDKL